MGRYYWSRRSLVSECKSLDIKFLMKHEYLTKECWKRGNVQWSRNGNPTGNIDIITSTGENPYIEFSYISTNRSTQEKKDYDYKRSLVSTPCHFGGIRWWFVCSECNCKCSTLYLDTADVFICRKCNNLAYDSQNQNRRGLWHQIGKVLDIDKRESMPQYRGRYQFYRGRPTRNFLRLEHSRDEIARSYQYLKRVNWL